ncbi:MAG TPA: hypothetical protein V6D17_24920 [Candidatus Obscuribacterales bacterium]
MNISGRTWALTLLLIGAFLTASSADSANGDYHQSPKNVTLRGGVSASIMRSQQKGVYQPQHMQQGLMLHKSAYGYHVTSPMGERTTMVPADFYHQTGVLGPANGGNYTPEFTAGARMKMNSRQIYAPQSVVHTDAAILKPVVIGTYDTIVNGIPQRVSGCVIMERPDVDLLLARAHQRRQATIASARRRQSYMASRQWEHRYLSMKESKRLASKRSQGM